MKYKNVHGKKNKSARGKRKREVRKDVYKFIEKMLKAKENILFLKGIENKEKGNNINKKTKEGEIKMRKKQIKLKRANAGITLIALIITVIVMLILAAVAINLTIGDNGIFKKSDEGAQIYKNAANNEAVSLNSAEQEMGDLISQYKGKPGKPDANGIYTENSTINGGEPSAFNPEIPKGFKPVPVDDAVWGDGTTPPTQDSVKKGLVIEDAEGNQFVWIAVDGTDVVLGRYVFTDTGEIDTALSKTEPTDQLKVSSSASYYYTEGLKDDTTTNTHAEDIEGFRTSVAEHGGYYLARYEASYGTDGKPNSKVSTSFVDEDGVTPTVEGQLWNNVTQPNAANACQNMYDNGTYGATSDLVNSYAWDTAIVFIQKYSDDSDYSRQNSLNTALANTGTNGDEKCHIQDMASNCFEWTTETSSSADSPCVLRGGIYYDSGSFTSYRINVSTSLADSYRTFRPLLYL